MRFQEELESYAKQVEEFQNYGDIEELTKYLKRAQTLDAKLQAASDKADKFNKEEEMFEWEVTNYPLRKQVSDFSVVSGLKLLFSLPNSIFSIKL